MKKITCIAFSALLALSTMAGCSQKPQERNNSAVQSEQSEDSGGKAAKSTGVMITLAHNMNGASSDAVTAVCNAFTNKTGINVEVQAPGGSYEETMKTRMAANSLPDIFTTHGWAVRRYGDYLRPLNDQPFVSRIKKTIIDQITDKGGNILTLPIDMQQNGIVYNENVIQKSKVDVDSIKTWDDFTAALAKIKAAGFTPIEVGGKDNWTIATIVDIMAPGYYTLNENNNYRSQLLDGTFDWSKWSTLCKTLYDWGKQGYFNKDALTCDYITSAKMLGSGEVGFEFGISAISDAMAAYPDAKIDVMPVPTCSDSDPVFLAGGENLAFGVWKDTSNEKESLQLMNFLAQKENCEKLATSTACPSGLTGAKSDLGSLQATYDKMSNVRVVPMFDREYLPSGMWDDMSVTGAKLLSGRSSAVDDAVRQMDQSYKAKLSQNQN